MAQPEPRSVERLHGGHSHHLGSTGQGGVQRPGGQQRHPGRGGHHRRHEPERRHPQCGLAGGVVGGQPGRQRQHHGQPDLQRQRHAVGCQQPGHHGQRQRQLW